MDVNLILGDLNLYFKRFLRMVMNLMEVIAKLSKFL